MSEGKEDLSAPKSFPKSAPGISEAEAVASTTPGTSAPEEKDAHVTGVAEGASGPGYTASANPEKPEGDASGPGEPGPGEPDESERDSSASGHRESAVPGRDQFPGGAFGGGPGGGGPPPTGTTPSAPPRTTSWGKLCLTALLAAALPCVLLGIVYLDQRRNEEQRLRTSQDLERRLRDEIREIARHVRQVDKESAAHSRVASQERLKINTHLGELDDADQDLHATLNELGILDDRRLLHWRIAELEHLLSIAVRQVSLLGDQRAAVRSLEAAAGQLAGIDDPKLVDFRRQLEEDLLRLRAVPLPDLAGLALQLSVLARRADKLALRGPDATRPAASEEAADSPDTAADTAETSRMELFFSSLMTELRGQFKIQRLPKKGQDTLPPEQRAHQERTLFKLYLENARLAVLRRDQMNFNTSMKAAISALRRQFDPRDSLVQSVLEELQKRADTRLQPALPVPTASLEALRRYRIRALQPKPSSLAPGAY